MSKVVVITMAVILSLFLITGGCSQGAPAQKAADFYKGKAIDLIVDSPAGSGPDLMARALKPYLDQYTGATVVVKNLGSAGGLEGDNSVFKATPDGLTIGLSTFISLLFFDLLDDPGAQFQIDKFGYLGCIGRESDVFWVKADGAIKSVADLKAAKNIKFVSLAPTTGQSVSLMITAYCLNLDAKIVPGFSSSESQLAVMRGDSAGFVSSPGSYLRTVSQGAKGLFVVDVKRSPALPDLPTMTEGLQLPKDKTDLLDVKAKLHAGRVLFTTPGIPADRLSFLQAALQQTVQRAEFRTDADKLMGYTGVPYPTASETTQAIKDLKAQKKFFQDNLKTLIKTYCPSAQ